MNLVLRIGSVLLLSSSLAASVSAHSERDSLAAQIIRTDFGVPHIKAKSLTGLGFGTGYAQAQDAACILADTYVRVNSERSKYFGPDKDAAGDSLNLVSDFGYKTLELRRRAEQQWPNLSRDSQALIEGFSQGYNHYLDKVALGEQRLPVACRDQEWVKPIDHLDVVTHLFYVAISASSDFFIDSMFYAHPGVGTQWQPTLALPEMAALSPHGAPKKTLVAPVINAELANNRPQTPDHTLMGSNAWALGTEVTESGAGILLANPHYPHTGSQRFWQAHIRMGRDININGAALLGMPGVMNIGHNNDLAWSLTVSDAEHMVLYRLALDPSDPTAYFIDGERKQMSVETVQVEVNTPAGLVTLEKDIYRSELGPLVEADDLMPWDQTQAYALKDINLGNIDTVDFFLALNRAEDLEDFQEAHKTFDGTSFSNTTYVDRQGNSFYIDDSTVPDLSPTAQYLINNDPIIAALREQFKVTLLPGHLSEFIFEQAVPYERAPKLLRNDYVQNANDSFWATNPKQLLTGFSPLYGEVEKPLSLRTRMGLKMLEDSRGEDKRFSANEVEQVLFSNRAYLGELIMPELLAQCAAQGNTPVVLSESISVDISPSCYLLSQWQSEQSVDRLAVHLFREFANLFDPNSHLVGGFDPTKPATTPAVLKADGEMLTLLALTQLNVLNAGFTGSEVLGKIQFVERTNADGSASGIRYPWPGSTDEEGGFNVFKGYRQHGSMALLHNYPEAINLYTQQPLSSGLTTEGYQVRSGSSWMMVVDFSDKRVKARGLMAYSQSSDPESPHYSDQTEYYAYQQKLRPMLYFPREIHRHALDYEFIRRRRH